MGLPTRLGILVLFAPLAIHADSLRFFGDAIPNRDRVMIRIDPHVPADVGATDFTLEFWMKANAAQNVSNGTCRPGSGENWITGNIMFDRAIWSHDRHGDYGIAIFSTGSSATLAFGVWKGGSYGQGLCGTRNVADGQWHHVAVTRVVASGQIRIYVDGQLDAQGAGPPGNISYQDNVPSQVPSYIQLNVDNYLGIGAEKYDADRVRYPSYSGWIDEVRISSQLRYTGNFARPTAPFNSDASTAALYHFDEGSGNTINDSAPGAASVGTRRPGGDQQGPLWSSDTPFTVSGTGTLALSATTLTVGEANGSVTLAVTRTGGSSGAASASFQTATGSATPGADYQISSGVVTWASGDASAKSISVALYDDAIAEPSETFGLTLTAASGAALGTPTSAIVTLVDNDSVAVPGQLQFLTSASTVSESAGAVVLSVARVGGSDGVVSVSYATANGTAVAPSDYQARAGLLTWASGDSSNKIISVPVSDDALSEGNETFVLTLSAPTGGAILASPAQSIVTLTDSPAGGGEPMFSDTFARSDSGELGNGWIEQHPAAFALVAGRAQKLSVNVSGDTVAYRPAAENILDAEASVELRLASTPPGYPQVFVRLQTNSLGGNTLVRYVLFIDDATGRAILANQQTAGGVTPLATLSLSPQLNTADTYRLRIRATRSDPVLLWAAVERSTATGWQTLGQATATDNSPQRIRTAGSAGFGGYREAAYSYDNFLRRLP